MGTPHTILMANLGMADSLIIMVIALVVFGPRRLPQIGRQIGKLMYEFRKASNDFKFQMEEELRNAEDADRRKKEEEERVRKLALAEPPKAAATETVPQASETDASAPSFTEAPATEAPAEETYPRIQPPRTGEPVEAMRPNRPTVPAQAHAANGLGAEVVQQASEEQSAPEAQHASEPEQAAHHG